MKKSCTKHGTICLLIMVLIAGCTNTKAPSVAVAPAPSPTPSPVPRLGAVLEGLRFSWSDKDGKRIAAITAESGAGTAAAAEDALGQLRNAKATLYQNGKPAATLTADTLDGNQKTRRITAVGNAVIDVLNSPDGIPSRLRADQIDWDYEKNQVTGRGKIVYTKENVISFPATFFTADTRLERFESRNDGSVPVTGNY